MVPKRSKRVYYVVDNVFDRLYGFTVCRETPGGFDRSKLVTPFWALVFISIGAYALVANEWYAVIVGAVGALVCLVLGATYLLSKPPVIRCLGPGWGADVIIPYVDHFMFGDLVKYALESMLSEREEYKKYNILDTERDAKSVAEWRALNVRIRDQITRNVGANAPTVRADIERKLAGLPWYQEP